VIDHLMLTVRDVARSRDFYRKALEPLGFGVQMEFEQTCAFGPPGKPCFWLRPGDLPTTPMHLAFMARDRPGVDAFHAAALAAGAADNGAPGLREHYHPNYYGGFVIDPDGHNVEAVCHLAPGVVPRRDKAPAARVARSAAQRPAGKAAARPVRKRALASDGKAAAKPVRTGRASPRKRGKRRR